MSSGWDAPAGAAANNPRWTLGISAPRAWAAPPRAGRARAEQSAAVVTRWVAERTVRDERIGISPCWTSGWGGRNLALPDHAPGPRPRRQGNRAIVRAMFSDRSHAGFHETRQPNVSVPCRR